MHDRTHYVYAYYRLDGVTPCYVGKGKGERWSHFGRRSGNPHLIRIVAQAAAEGKTLPRAKLADQLTEQEAFALEREFIAKIGRAANGGPLVNLTDGGDGFTGRHREESKAKTSAALKGRAKSPEHIAAAAAAKVGISQSHGWWSTPEGRAKQRANNPGNTGKSFSDEKREKIRRATIRQFASSKARKAVQVSPVWARRNSIRHSAVA